MVSKEAQKIIAMLRQQKKQAVGIPKNIYPDYARRREFIEARYAQQPGAEGVAFYEGVLSSVPVGWAEPEQPDARDIILYIHGGGFQTGSHLSSRPYATWLSKVTGKKTYTVGYRLAPEHPFPTALEDCMAVYRTLQEQFPQKRIILVGGSAGGNLCLGLTHRIKAEKGMIPGALILFSPVADQTNTLDSRKRNAWTDCMISPDIDEDTGKTYLLDADRKDPLVSPVYGNFMEWPPVKIVVDSSEVLLDDSLMLAQAIAHDGGMVELQVTQGLFHDFPSSGVQLPEALMVLDDIHRFIERL